MDPQRCGVRLIPLGLWLVGVPFLLTLPLNFAPGALPPWLLQGLPAAVVVEWVVALGDKAAHALLFGVGAWLLHRIPLPLVTAILGASAYGGLMEWVQSFLPSRSAEWGDVLANGVGGVAYALGVAGCRQYRQRRGIR